MAVRISRVVIVLAVLLAGPFEHAADSPKDTAKALAKTAAVFAAEKKWEEAIRLYQQAYSMDPAPVLLFNVGAIYEKLGDLRHAREQYERFVKEEKDPIDRKAGRDRLNAVLDRLPGHVVLRSDPSGVAVKVDGKAGGKTPTEPLALKPGPHRFDLQADGYEPATRQVVVEADRDQEVAVELVGLPGGVVVRCPCPGAKVDIDREFVGVVPIDRPLSVRAGRHTVMVHAEGMEPFRQVVDVVAGQDTEVEARLTTPLAAPIELEDTSDRFHPWHWVAIGTGAAMLATGVVLTAVAAHDRSKVTGAGRTDGVVTGITAAEASSLETAARRMSGASVAMYTLGGAALITGVVLYCTRHEPGARPGTQDGPPVSASPVPGGALVTATARF